MSSKVYFTNMNATVTENLPQKLRRLIDKAGLGTIDFKNKFVAIKAHFGEPGNLAYLRPNYAKVIVDYVRERGGVPFLTDCNTLYIGRRKNAIEHLESAYENGFNPLVTGCHVLIADGLRGTDDEAIKIDGEFVKEAHIGKAIADADIVISLNHFKGHCEAGFGGALKNLGMGSGSRAGKTDMHSAGKPSVTPELCVGCKRCIKNCAHGAIEYTPEHKAKINHDRCLGCGRCIGLCNSDAIEPVFDESFENLNCKIAEYAMAVCKDKPTFHISLAIDISPDCDCFNTNDVPIVPDIGMFASFDPVAIDAACADAVNSQPKNENGQLSGHRDGDCFSALHPGTRGEMQIVHAEKIGLGTSDYTLVTI